MFRSVALGAGVLFLALSAPAFSSQDSVLIDKFPRKRPWYRDE